MRDTGPNAIRALEGLGVLDAVLLRSSERILTQRAPRFVTGLGKHEHIYDVTYAHYIFSSQNQPFLSSTQLCHRMSEWEYIGMYFGLSDKMLCSYSLQACISGSIDSHP
jgi:hypothetical protein